MRVRGWTYVFGKNKTPVPDLLTIARSAFILKHIKRPSLAPDLSSPYPQLLTSTLLSTSILPQIPSIDNYLTPSMMYVEVGVTPATKLYVVSCRLPTTRLISTATMNKILYLLVYMPTINFF